MADSNPVVDRNEKNTIWWILNLIFSLFPSTTAKTCSSGLVLFGSLGWKVLSDIIPKTKIIITNYYSCIKNTCHVKTKKTYNAGQQCTGPERGGGDNRYKTMYKANWGGPYGPQRCSGDDNCSARLWDVFVLLDGTPVCEVWDCLPSDSIEVAWEAICWDTGKEWAPHCVNDCC